MITNRSRPPALLSLAGLRLLLITARVLVARDVRRLLRQRGRALTSLFGPVLILTVFGAGYGAMLDAGTHYRTFFWRG